MLEANNMKCHGKFVFSLFTYVPVFTCNTTLIVTQSLYLNKTRPLINILGLKSTQRSIPTGTRIVNLEALQEGLKV